MDLTSRRPALLAALMMVVAGPAWALPGAIAAAHHPARAAADPLPAGPGLASSPEHAPRGLARSDPDDPPPLTPIRDPGPMDPPQPQLIVERTGPISAAPGPLACS